MKNLFVMMAVLVGVASSASAKEIEVEMKSISFAPKVVSIAVGDSIVWKNVSYTDHGAASDSNPSAFDTGMIHPKEKSKPVVFNQAGSFPYHCKMHGQAMSGVVNVGTK